MTRTTTNHSIDRRFDNPVPVPKWWRSQERSIQTALDEIEVGKVVELASSPGGRPVRAVMYGQAEEHLRGLANFNSAVGSLQESAYWDRGKRQRPVLLILAGVHGHEVEGMMGAMSVVRLMERGEDLAGRPQPALLELLQQLRVVVVPLANPDGRARVPYDGFVGLERDEMTRVGQGTRADGTSYGWRGCKAVHPMTGDVGALGGYFDDAGVNLMHDEFFAPMSPVTPALLGLVGREGPDIVLNLHSYTFPPGVLGTAYVPLQVKQQIADFARRYYQRMEEAGLPHLPRVPAVKADEKGEGNMLPFNLNSATWHAGASLAMVFESSHGLDDPEGPTDFSYDEILTSHHLLFETAAKTLLSRELYGGEG